MEEEERIRAENLFKARGAAPQEAETDQFKCGKCKQRKTRYYQMQTRSADERSIILPLLEISCFMYLCDDHNHNVYVIDIKLFC